MTVETRTLSPSPCDTLSAAEEPPDSGSIELHQWSARLAALVRPVRILEAIRWTSEIEARFFAHHARELPAIDGDYYARRPLPFDPTTVQEGLLSLEREIGRKLGKDHPGGQLLLPRCRESRLVIDLVLARGTKRFATMSRRLYGSGADALPAGAPSLLDMARRLARTSGACLEDPALSREPRTLDATTAAHQLSARLGDYFAGDPSVKVIVTDDMDASASVGGDCLKVRRDAWFCPRDVRLLEVHEGWVHLGTSRNARRQPICSFLSRPLPRATRTQEGLAVWTEVLSFASHATRLRLLAGRVEAVAMAEQGANFLEVFRHFESLGLGQRECYQQAARIFRGSLPDAGPFTKDLAYAHGFAEVGQFLKLAVSGGQMGLVPLLFCGKVSLADLPALAELHDRGVLRGAQYLPQPFADLRALAALICFLGCQDEPIRAGLQPCAL